MADLINSCKAIRCVSSGEANTASPQPRQTVLLVDDDPDYLSATAIGLSAAGYRTISAESAAEAEALLAQPGFAIDAAVVDLMMEESDAGFTLCHRLKRRFSECPIVMVSGVVSDARMAFDHHGPGGAWMKVDGFLPKPVRIEQLRRELCRLLDGDGAAVAKERR